MYEYVSGKCGAQIRDAQDAFYLYDALSSEQLYGYKLPDWASDVLLSKLKDSKNKFISLNQYSRKLQRLRTGLFLNDLLENIKDSINLNFDYKKQVSNENERTAKKLYVYSTVSLNVN